MAAQRELRASCEQGVLRRCAGADRARERARRRCGVEGGPPRPGRAYADASGDRGSALPGAGSKCGAAVEASDAAGAVAARRGSPRGSGRSVEGRASSRSAKWGVKSWSAAVDIFSGRLGPRKSAQRRRA
ncbi:hypothetical protein Tco_1020096 [Tanacetum coccineum]|uniref:Uncharacterized protein n=1 Tax=Tanacetum coccineum TaxID=301880 RepID=A0ABQ5FZ32_9ASTR